MQFVGKLNRFVQKSLGSQSWCERVQFSCGTLGSQLNWFWTSTSTGPPGVNSGRGQEPAQKPGKIGWRSHLPSFYTMILPIPAQLLSLTAHVQCPVKRWIFLQCVIHFK